MWGCGNGIRPACYAGDIEKVFEGSSPSPHAIRPGSSNGQSARFRSWDIVRVRVLLGVPYAREAQLVEHSADNREAGGSSPPASTTWGHSSIGRAPALQAGGCRFDPGWFHHILQSRVLATHRPHTPFYVGSNPTSATIWLVSPAGRASGR